MKTKLTISDEMLAAYMAGNATAHETAAIVHALDEDAILRETMQILSEASLCEEGADVLPMTAMAADDCDRANRCALLCEAYILRQMGIAAVEDNLVKEAEQAGWLREEGTALYNIGRVSEQYHLVASRRYECTRTDIAEALGKGKQVIAVVDTVGDGVPNHSVVVKRMTNDTITIFDPEPNFVRDIPIVEFEAQWEASHHYIVIIGNATPEEYEPHPIDLTDVQLDPNMTELREAIAENAHEVWAAARKSQGWTWGPARSDDKKQTPDMVPYSQLTDQEKQYDRDMAENTIKLLIKLGWEIKKK